MLPNESNRICNTSEISNVSDAVGLIADHASETTEISGTRAALVLFISAKEYEQHSSRTETQILE
jgi:hypothetical protein